MINKIFKQTYFYLNKIKIVHSIPGRIRISIPGLNSVPEGVKKYEKNVTDLILLLKGVESSQYSYITNNILIKYNPNALNEDTIIQWLNIILKKVLEKETLIKEKSLSEIEKDFSRLYSTLKKELSSLVPKGEYTK